MDNDTLKQINDNLKRFNGKLILENEALKKQIETLKKVQPDPAVNQSNFYQLSQKVQDLMIKNDALTDENDNLKFRYSKLAKNHEYLRQIAISIERNKGKREEDKEDVPPPLNTTTNSLVLKEKLKDLTGSKYLNPVYDRISLMLTAFFEKGEINSEFFKTGFAISRATFARDTKILKDLGYIELMNSKKEGIFILTKSGKKLKKELKKDLKKLPL